MKSLVCITGATGGLGKAFAVECAGRGWDLFLTDLSEAALRQLSESLSNTYDVNVYYRSCDLTDYDARSELFGYLDQLGRSVHFLINIAGLDFEGPFSERSRKQITTILRLNIEANLEMTSAVLKLRDSSKPFRIINVASLAAYYPMPVKAMYASSKRFLLNFSKALREEIRSLGATVTALCPAGMPTTADCIKSIEAQGLAGLITTKNVGFVAAGAVNSALKGKAVYIPGLLNRVIWILGCLVPSSLVAKIIGMRWRHTYAKWAVQNA
jgi:short-subunit dehydrogenase